MKAAVEGVGGGTDGGDDRAVRDLGGRLPGDGDRGSDGGRGQRHGDGPEPGREPALDCGLVACGLLLWLLTDFVYGDIGGPSTMLVALGLGLAAWWALAGGEYRDAVARSTVPERVEEAAAR